MATSAKTIREREKRVADLPANPESGTRTVPVFLHGARGMLAGEFLRLLEFHPGLRLAAAVSREAGAVHRHLGAGTFATEANVA